MPNTCYMCNSQATSVEHVPPRCLFPEQKDLDPGLNLRKQLITVPSCDEHNSKKSRDDEYLLYVLVFNIPNNETAENHFRTKLFRAIQRNPNLAQMLSKENIPVSVVNNENGQFSNTYAFKVDNERLEDALEMVGRALYFHHNQTPWQGKIQVISNFLLAIDTPHANESNERVERLTQYVQAYIAEQESPVLGDNPEVFSYQIATADGPINTLMLLRFYGGSLVTLLFRPHDVTHSQP